MFILKNYFIYLRKKQRIVVDFYFRLNLLMSDAYVNLESHKFFLKWFMNI